MIWKERKRLWCGLPWTFTVYSFDESRFYVDTGFLNQKHDEVRLYRIMDISMSRSFLQRIFGLGTIQLHTSDKSLGNFSIINIKNVAEVNEKLSNAIDECRTAKNVRPREYMDAPEEVEDI